MTRNAGRVRTTLVVLLLALGLTAGAGSLSAALAQTTETEQQFWHIPVWVQPGAWQDSTVLFPNRCPGGFHGPLPDSLREQARTLTVRFLRNRRVEALPGFGGYRVYRGTSSPDTSTLVLVRRYSVNSGDTPLWNFSRVNTTTLEFECRGGVVHDSIATYVDPDSSGSYQKVCRRVNAAGQCLSKGDSIWALVAPSGPHDGFRTWYTVTYEAKNLSDNDYTEMFVPDTSDDYARCDSAGDPATCPNLNNKLANMTAEPIEPTAGPTANLLTVTVVPNPFRESERWDRPDGHEAHFINLPAQAKIRIYTVAGDLVRELQHSDTVRDFERWDLKNANGRDVVSGIYMYRVEAGSFSAQNRFVVIR
jgi:hypothetical protein